MFDAIFDAPVIIQIHLFSALEALILGPFILYRRRRDRLHKILGYMWVSNMAIAAGASFFINEIRVIGAFSPIHLLSIVTLISLWNSVQAARAGNLRAHRSIMNWLYWAGLVAAGVMSFLPGRILSTTLAAMPTPVAAAFVTVSLLALGFTAWLALGKPLPLRRVRAT